jgi:excisionase family DNA binding protein
MAHAPYLREKARRMRVDKKLTIDELAERLALSRSTVYYWVKDLPIEGSGCGGPFRTHAQRMGTRAMQAKYKRRRDEAYEEGKRTFHALAADPTFRDFVCLYMAEGYKKNRNVVSIANSDPAVIVIAQEWMSRLSEKRKTYWIQYHADQNLDELRGFWGATLRVDAASIKLLRKSNSNQMKGRTWRSKHGVMSVTCNDTLFRSRLGAWMDLLRSNWTTRHTIEPVGT